jgi:hypothetical protein
LINKTVNEGGQLFSHLVIDSVPIYDDFEDYFVKNMPTIENVEIITKTYEENIWDIIVSTYEYLAKAIEQMDRLADNFYKTPKVQDWNDLANLFEGISWILESTELINTDNRVELPIELWRDYNENVVKLLEQVDNLSVAMENDDRVTIADMLSYEIAPIFKALQGVCKALMSQR